MPPLRWTFVEDIGVSKRHRRARLRSDPLTRGDLDALVSTRSHRSPFVLMPRDADDVRRRLVKKLKAKREQERQNALSREQLRLSHIKETRDKINALDKSIGKGTGVLRDIEKVSAQIRAQSFADGVSQDERDSGSLALDRLDRQRVAMEKNLAEWNESVGLLQDVYKQLSND